MPTLDATDLAAIAAAVSPPRTLWVATTGNDANDGLYPGTAKATLASALTAASGGGWTIRMASGAFSFGATAHVMPDNTLLRGTGAATKILSTCDFNSDGPTIKPGNNCEIRDLYIENAVQGFSVRVCVGATNAQGAFVNAHLRNVYMKGSSDVVVVDKAACSLFIYDSVLESTFDQTNIFSNGTGSLIETFRTLFWGNGQSTNQVQQTGIACAGPGTVRIHGGSSIQRHTNSGATLTTAVYAAGGTIELTDGVSLDASAPAGLVKHITQSNSGVVKVRGAIYDPNKVTGAVSVDAQAASDTIQKIYEQLQA